MDIEVTGHQLAHPTDVREMPDLEFLRDEKLNRSASFRELRGQVEKHFQKANGMHPEKSHQWKSVLYNSLLTCLREVAFTSDSTEQVNMLKRVHRWYRKKTNRPSMSTTKQIPKTTVAFDSSSYNYTEPKKSQTLRPIETRSLSPMKSTKPPVPIIPEKRDIDLFKPFVTPIPSIPIEEAKLMQRLHDYQQRKLKELRTVILEKKGIIAWGKDRSRYEETSMFLTEQRTPREIARPITHLSDMTNLKRRSPSPMLVDLRSELRSLTPSSVAIESITDRITQFRQRNAELLHIPEESPARRSTATSLSFYTNRRDLSSFEIRRPPTPSHTPIPRGSDNKPTVAVSLSPLRKSKVVEMMEVKRKLALANLPCTFRILKDGLLEPDNLPATMLTPQSLPQGGELLQSNPFFGLGKGKKKKLKKKK